MTGWRRRGFTSRHLGERARAESSAAQRQRRRVLLPGSALLLIVASFLVPAPPAGAATPVTLYVNATSSGVGDCSSAGDACASIQTAITVAEADVSSDVTIEVGPGTYVANDTIDVPSTDTLTIEGTTAGAPTASGGSLGSVFTITGGTVAIDDVTISAGAASTSGGGVDNAGGTVTLNNDTLTADTATTSGGGLFNAAGATAVLVNDTLSSDSSGTGGGVDNEGSATLTNDTLANDTAANGGGLSSETGATTSVANSILDDASCFGEVVDDDYNVESDNTCGFGASDVVSSATIGLAGSLAANGSSGPETLAIGRTSSAFEEVPAANCTSATDERVDPRPGVLGVIGAKCDAGSFEDQIASASLSLTGSPIVGNNTYDVGLSVPTGAAVPSEAVAVTDSSSQSCLASLTPSTATLYTGSCTIDNEAVGVTVTAAYDADSADLNFLEATSNTLTVAAMSQSITFTSSVPASPTVGGTYTVTATGGASGISVTFSVGPTSAVGACSIIGAKVSLTGAGICVILANQAGNANYSAAPEVAQAFTISAGGSGPTSPGSQVITFTSSVPSPPIVGGSYVVSATGGASGNPVTFSIDATSTAGACTIDDATVSLLAIGTCVIDANQAGNANYQAAPQVQQTVSIVLAGQVITFTSSVPSSPKVGGTYVVSATGGASGNPVTFSIDATSSAGACTISDATVSLVGVGSCVIDANQAGNASYSAAPEANQRFVVRSASSTGPPTKLVPKIVIHLDTFAKAGAAVHETIKLSCIRAACSGLVSSLGQITTSKFVSEKSGPWTITKKVTTTVRVLLTRASYRLAEGKSGVLTLTVSANGRSALAKANSTTPLYETLTATVKGGLMVTKSTNLH